MTDLGQYTARALAIAEAYDRLNLAQRGRTWTTEELALGFVGDVGDLAKLVMASAGTRDIPNHRELLGHELADCLWAVLVIAARTGVDLAAEFDACMQMLNGIIARKLAELED
jgi:NTP pyrophosphatase (non-canonical NTP hydrolase)